MYVEARRPDGGIRLARIARVRFSKSGRTIHFDGREFSGPRRDGNDRGGNRPGSFPIEIDEDARREYWTDIRGEPERAAEAVTYG
jgi:hypothetical protein